MSWELWRSQQHLLESLMICCCCLVFILRVTESWVWGILRGLIYLFLLFSLVFITVGSCPKEAFYTHSTLSQARKADHNEDEVQFTLCEPFP